MLTLPNGIKKVEASDNATIDNFNINAETIDAAVGSVNAATSAATPNAIAKRDASGRMKAAAPAAADDVARKAEVDAMLPKSGGELSGSIILPNNTAIYGKDTGGTPQAIGLVGNNNQVTLGDLDLETNVRGTNVKINGNTAWHAGNDGAESGLDADTVDGLHAAALARLSGATFTGGVIAPDLTGRLTHGYGYFNIQSYNDVTYGVGCVQGHYRPNTGYLYLEGRDASNAARDLTLLINGSAVWDRSALRTSSGYLEWNDGGTWKAVGGVKSVQRNVSTIAGAGSGSSTPVITDVTISDVNVNKAQLNITSPAIFGDGSYISAQLINSTTIRFTSLAHNARPVAWEVIEHY